MSLSDVEQKKYQQMLWLANNIYNIEFKEIVADGQSGAPTLFVSMVDKNGVGSWDLAENAPFKINGACWVLE